jgi:SAM-dependent methyltransferase
MDDRLAAQTRAGYDAAASAYAESLPDTSFEAGIDLAMIDHFVAQLPDASAVLDAGCGTGRMLTYLRGKDASLTLAGTDLSANMLAEAKKLEVDADLVQADFAALPYAGGTFDGVLAWYSIIHTPPHALRTIFAEFRRAAARGCPPPRLPRRKRGTDDQKPLRATDRVDGVPPRLPLRRGDAGRSRAQYRHRSCPRA